MIKTFRINNDRFLNSLKNLKKGSLKLTKINTNVGGLFLITVKNEMDF